ncbi:hypothetical protein ZYGR_0N04310 [Zygosaccharomyces rouxii]|uniref:ZYRO0D10186p n=2 Tax=Zygosaccharomyces rouxii TaxID=4956 RepID=C5DVX5_ZYGRC|nr:uncharacterized protein ZYRO0D10186g [Zygosaccharomyces rouxii]KAH9200854.1 hypothetical protein LQ764DRAFT_100737 [Zygosaccharomyces rouxii]GAV49026.1 hypothetical protein ZYGR_0N04310 [Zygosaccharomyces rouxii]CAR27944.1 ZYRO0D10186p [Zygosaccharomyces rouxii]
MGDPFADLLTQFKGGESKPQNQGNKPLAAQYSENNTRETSSSLSLQPEPVTTASNYKIDDDFEQLFGIKSNTNTNNSDVNNRPNTTNQNEFDSAIDLLQITPEKQRQSAEREPEQLVDEVRDMEVAKLMSLGYSIDGANTSYEQGMLYDDVIEERKKKKLHRRELQRLMAETNWERETPETNNDESGKNNVDLFSIASGIFNKGKKIVDHLSLFPDEENDLLPYRSERLKQRQTFEPELPRRPRKDPTPNPRTQGTPQVEYESTLQYQQPTIQAQEGDLLGDFQDKLSLRSQGNKSTSASQSPSNETLLDFDAPSANSTSASVSVSRQGSVVPTVPITEIELSGYNEFKDRAGELFKTGDYVAALQEYEKSANTLPHGHPLRIISYSNLMASQLKTGQYKESLHVASMALKLFPEDTTQWTQLIQNSEPSKTYRDMWPKIVQRRAEAFEHSENFQEAFNAYQSLIEKNFCTNKIMDGKRRCQKVLNPEKPKVVQKKPASSKSPSPSPNHSDKKYKNLQKVKEDNRKQAEEDTQRHALYDRVYDQIKLWESGKANDIRHLLSNLQTVLTWVDWKPVSPADLVMPKKVKITYLRAVAKTHPDKISDSLPLDKKMIAESVFSSLSSAWEKFKSENDIN